MDEITSNINITCDMLNQIIRNLIVLSNTSSNISPATVASLLEEAQSNSSSTIQNRLIDFPFENQDHNYHLYHPLHSNNQLNQYRRKSTTMSSVENLNNDK